MKTARLLYPAPKVLREGENQNPHHQGGQEQSQKILDDDMVQCYDYDFVV